ncbi:hypothetical protein HJFPF1_06486 [Paramyrothecium foliicola]|nr:hypothetical protein HJFPF1_06486 [Paramyrothecium foliicola]
MSQPRVLRVNRSDDDSAFVLFQISSSGTKPLDLKIIATEGEAPYVATLKNDKVASLRVKNCPASEKEWHAILSSLLNQEYLPDIQATATVQSESTISVTIRKQIQGITQRLGSIILNHDADEAIELFEWCGTAAEAAASSQKALADASANAQKLNDTIAELKAQLDELVQVKQDDETALLLKFRDLLNEKKVKIREQQKLLATASLGDDDRAAVPSSPPPAPEQKRRPGKSRPAKRKVQPTTVEEYSGEEGIERMDVDEVKAETRETDSDRETEETASIASDENADADDNVPNVTDAKQAASSKAGKDTHKKQAEQPPPRRELPFTHRKNNNPATAKSAPPPHPGSETESDDEL